MMRGWSPLPSSMSRDWTTMRLLLGCFHTVTVGASINFHFRGVAGFVTSFEEENNLHRRLFAPEAVYKWRHAASRLECSLGSSASRHTFNLYHLNTSSLLDCKQEANSYLNNNLLPLYLARYWCRIEHFSDGEWFKGSRRPSSNIPIVFFYFFLPIDPSQVQI